MMADKVIHDLFKEKGVYAAVAWFRLSNISNI
jgi:hypothetical protein